MFVLSFLTLLRAFPGPTAEGGQKQGLLYLCQCGGQYY
jgi:hypothetical protein